MKISGWYVLRFFGLTALLFLIYPKVISGYTTLVVAPVVAAVPHLHARQVQETVTFGWLEGPGTILDFSDLHPRTLFANLIVFSALILAFSSPLKRRLRAWALGIGILYLVNILQVAVVLLYNYREAASVVSTSRIGAFAQGCLSIAYHMNKQVGTIVVPFALLLLLSMRQRNKELPSDPDAKKELVGEG